MLQERVLLVLTRGKGEEERSRPRRKSVRKTKAYLEHDDLQ